LLLGIAGTGQNEKLTKAAINQVMEPPSTLHENLPCFHPVSPNKDNKLIVVPRPPLTVPALAS
jgi:hypothetical protein